MNVGRRQFRRFGALTLGAWIFALLVGTANACSTLVLPAPVSAHGHSADVGPADGSAQDPPNPSCVKFCSDDTPLKSKVQLTPDEPVGQPPLPASYADVLPDVRGAGAAKAPFAQPPPVVPVYLRSLRLAL